MHVKAELFVKLRVVIVMNIFVYDILSKIKVVFGTDSLAIERGNCLIFCLNIKLDTLIVNLPGTKAYHKPIMILFSSDLYN